MRPAHSAPTNLETADAHNNLQEHATEYLAPIWTEPKAEKGGTSKVGNSCLILALDATAQVGQPAELLQHCAGSGLSAGTDDNNSGRCSLCGFGPPRVPSGALVVL